MAIRPGDVVDGYIEAMLFSTNDVQRTREMRVEGDKTIVFPSKGIWHSITLTEA